MVTIGSYVSLLLWAGEVVRAAPAAPVFGPVDVLRGTGAPVTRTWNFNVTLIDPAGYTLCLTNGGQNRQYPPITSARVTLNSVAVMKPQDFNPNVTQLERRVTLKAANKLEIEVAGKPGSGITVAIQAGPTCAGAPQGNRPPVITSTPVTSATLLQAYNYPVIANDPDGGTLAYSLTTSPLGMSIDAGTGAVTWLPPGTGPQNVVVRVADPQGIATTQSFTLTVGTSANRPPHLTPVSNRRVPAGVPFQLDLSADDPDPGDTQTFFLNSGPSGSAITQGRAVRWTPSISDLGPHAFSVSVRDSAGAVDTGSFSLDVVASNGAPLLDALDNLTTSAGTPLTRFVTAIDPNPNDVLTFALATGPAGLTLASDGRLAWTPSSSQLGDHRVTVTVRDSSGLVDAGAFTISVGVTASSQPPTARNDRYAVRRGTTLQVPPPGVLSNDEDPNGLPLGAVLGTNVTKGSLTLGADGSVMYTPNASAAGGTAPQLAFSQHYVEGALTIGNVVSQPLVADLDGDGKAEIVYLGMATFSQRRLVAVHGDTGTVAWAANAYQPPAAPNLMLCSVYCELAAGDLDNNGRVEIIAVQSDNESTRLRNRLAAFNFDGTLRWISDDVLDGTVTQTYGLLHPTLADLDGDGVPEILTLHTGKTTSTPTNVISEDLLTVFNSDGHIRWTVRVPGRASSSRLTVADIDVDGKPEIVIGGAVFNADGTARWNIKSASATAVLDVAVGNLDDDPSAEIVYTDNFANLYCFEHTGAMKWGPVKNPSLSGFSLVSIGDVDGDGSSEILMARDGVEVWSRAGVLLRTMSLPNGYLGYGGTPTIFDLNGDGRPEVIYNGAIGPHDVGFARGAVYIFDGPTGTWLHSVYATRNAGNNEQGPLVADVNGDGSAEIVTGSWNDTQATLRVYKAASGVWAKTRPIWNQDSYHATNVLNDGRVPALEPINWLTPGLNTFRVNMPLPSDHTEDRDRFTYTATNGTSASNIATVDIDILPPNTAPLILSTPPAAAAPGIEYVYAVRAVDPDLGELMTFSLPIHPAGMTVDMNTGLVRWTPGLSATGSMTAVVKVTDSQGQSSSQSFTVVIAPPSFVPTVVGAPLADAPAQLAGAGLGLGTVTQSPSGTVAANSVMGQEPLPGSLVPQGTLVNLVVSSGPAPVIVPYVIGKTESDGVARLTTMGFGSAVSRVFSNTVPAGRIVGQTPVAGTPLIPGSVQITVSAGSGLRMRLQRNQTSADASIAFTTSAYDLQFVDVPSPALTYVITPAITPAFGALPAIVGNTIAPAADTRGAFRVTATDPTTGRVASADFAVVAPHAPGKRLMNDVFADLSAAMSDIEGLIRQGRGALAVGDSNGVTSALQQMVSRWRQVDRKELRLATPFGLPNGFFPTPADLAALNLTPTANDLLAIDVLEDADEDLRAWIAGLREPSTSMSTLNALADRFNTRAARLSSMTLSEWGAIQARPLLNALIADRLPELYGAVFDEVALALARANGGGPSTLAEVVVTTAMQYVVDQIADNVSSSYKNAKQFATDVLIQAAWSAAIVTAAHHFREFTQAQEITAVVAGASLSFHLFESPWSWIEADVDTDEPDNSVVVTVGPDVLYSVLDAIDKIKSVTKFGETLDPNAPKDDGRAKNMDDLFDGLKALYQALKDVQSSAENVVQQVKNAFQPSGVGSKGCVFSSAPTCGQLQYENGLTSVYHYSPPAGFQTFTGIPVPIFFLVYDRNTGGVQMATPVFLPTPLP